MRREFDFIIIGSGIVGSLIARNLSKYEGQVLLIDKEADVCMGASAANTAIVHAGYDPIPGTLKAKMNVLGNPMWDQLAGELNFPFSRMGDYVVAIGKEELPKLELLMEQGRKNGVPGMHLISRQEMIRREKQINPNVSGAIWASTGGICDPFQVTISAAENAVKNGVKVKFNTTFENFIFEGKKIIGVKTNKGDYFARWIINSAGVYSDVVMHKAGIRPEFEIKPRKGEYFVFDRAEFQISTVLFQVPAQHSKGIMVTTSMHGNTILGPNANVIEDKEDTSVTQEGMEEIWKGAHKLIPGLKQKHIIAQYAGLRPMGNASCESSGIDYHHDFIIEIPEEVDGFVNLGGIESPGLASSPAIAQEVINLLKDAGENLVKKKIWDPIRPPRPRFRDLSRNEQRALVEMDPRYGKVICRCENVTEGEIIAEIHAPIPARTYDAIKRRTWLGTGRCQGGFDTPRVIKILAEELGVSPMQISKRGQSSGFVVRPTKRLEKKIGY